MKIPITGSITIVALLLLALATSGCESTPLLAPTGASMTLLASPVSAIENPNLDPSGDYYFTTIFGQLLDSGSGGTTTTSGTAAATRSSPLVGVSVTFAVSGGNLRFNSCVQGVCSLDSGLCPGGAADCTQPTSEPLTVDTDSSGVVQVVVAVTDSDPASITVTALSGTINQNVSFGNPLGAPNDEPQAEIGVTPPSSPVFISGGSVSVTFFSESTDPDGDPITCYEWTINSSTSASNTVRGPDADIVSQTYSSEQSLDVLLRVTDDSDAATNCTVNTRFSPNVDTISGYLICDNTAPTASFVVGPADTQTSTVAFEVNGQASTDPETDIQHYQWDCDNGQDPTGVQTSCTYNRTTVTQFKEIELVVTDFSAESGCELESTPSLQTVTIPALGSP